MAVATVPGVVGVTENPIPVTINGSAALSLATQIAEAFTAASIAGTLQVAVNHGLPRQRCRKAISAKF